MLKRFISIILLVVSFIQIAPTYACSGGRPYTLSEIAANAEVIVQGHMVMTDERGQNGVLQVESVLSGENIPQYILLDLAPSFFIHRQHERFSGGCFYGVNALPTNQTIIFFLKKMPNNAYQIAPIAYQMGQYYPFPGADTKVTIYKASPIKPYEHQAEPPLWSTQQVDHEIFTYLISQFVGQPPHPPRLNTPYPLPTSLYIRTVAGTEYELPVDFSPPHKLDSRLADENGDINPTGCKVVNCIGVSPNGIDSAQVTQDYTVNMLSFPNATVRGTAFHFSPTSDAIAVWNTDTLSVYALPYDRLGLCCYQLFLMNSISLNNVLKPTTDVAWTPDGRMLAYNDSTGLYLWDVFTSASRPRLLTAPLYRTVTPRFFSKTGRYLAIQKGDDRYYMDTVSGAELADGALSTDDRTLLQFDTQHESPLSFYHLAPFNHFNTLDKYDHVRQAQWLDDNRFLVVDCSPDQTYPCAVYPDSLSIGGGYYPGYAFAYDKVTQTIAIAMSGKQIGVLTQTTAVYKTYDFSASLDAEIESIQWMQPIFFQPD